MIEKWRKSLDTEVDTVALLPDLSKAFDYLDQELITKLNAYGFDTAALKFIYSYLKRRKH